MKCLDVGVKIRIWLLKSERVQKFIISRLNLKNQRDGVGEVDESEDAVVGGKKRKFEEDNI